MRAATGRLAVTVALLTLVACSTFAGTRVSTVVGQSQLGGTLRYNTDLATGQVSSSPNFGGSVIGGVVDPVRNRFWYFSSGTSGEVGSYDLTRNRIEPWLSLGFLVYALVYDPQRQSVFAAFEGKQQNGEVSEINATSRAVIANVSLPFHPYYMTLDTKTGNLFVSDYAGHMAVVSTTTKAMVASFKVDGAVGGMVFNPVNGNIYVANDQIPGIDVLNGTTFKTLSNITTQYNAYWDVVDSKNGNVYAATIGPIGQNVNTTMVVINAHDSVIGSISMAGQATSGAYDSVKDLVYVSAGSTPANIQFATVNPQSNTIVSSFGTQLLYQMSYNPVDGLVYAPGEYYLGFMAVDPQTHASITFPLVYSVTGVSLDAQSGNTYAASIDQGRSTLVLSVLERQILTANVTLGSTPTQCSWHVAAGDGRIFLSNSINATVLVVNSTTLRNIARFELPSESQYLAYDKKDALLYAVTQNPSEIVSVNPQTMAQKSLPLSLPGSSYYDQTTDQFFVAGPATVTVINGSTDSEIRTVGLNLMGIPASLAALSYNPFTKLIYGWVAETSQNGTLIEDLAGFNSTSGAALKVVEGTNQMQPFQMALDQENGLLYGLGFTGLFAFDSVSLTFVAKITLGSGFPSGMVLDPSSGNLYVSGGSPGAVSTVATGEGLGVSTVTSTIHETETVVSTQSTTKIEPVTITSTLTLSSGPTETVTSAMPTTVVSTLTQAGQQGALTAASVGLAAALAVVSVALVLTLRRK